MLQVCLLVFVAAAAVLTPTEGQPECPCKNHTLCQPLATKPYKEVLAFVVNQVGECLDMLDLLVDVHELSNYLNTGTT